MCFVRRKTYKGSKKLRVAWKPIVCYKTINENMDSLVMDFKYKMYKRYWRPHYFLYFLWIKLFNIRNIESGFHSFINLEKRSAFGLQVECRIPRFSLYYKNEEYGEYVATGIKLIKKIYDNG